MEQRGHAQSQTTGLAHPHQGASKVSKITPWRRGWTHMTGGKGVDAVARGEAREELGTPQNLTQVTAGLGVPLPELRHTREGKMWGN